MTQEFINYINNLLENNKPKKALDYCKKELAKYNGKEITKETKSQTAEIYYTMSSILASCGKTKEAIQWIDNAILNNPNDDSYYYYRAELHIENAHYENAIQDYSKCIKLNPTSLTYGKRGTAKILTGNYNGAVIDCTKAIKLNPDFGDGYIERGRAKHQTENFVGAIRDFSKVIEMFPELAFPYGLRADSKIKAGDIQGALEDYKQLKKLDPRNEIAKNAIKNINNMQNQNSTNINKTKHSNIMSKLKEMLCKK